MTGALSVTEAIAANLQRHTSQGYPPHCQCEARSRVAAAVDRQTIADQAATIAEQAAHVTQLLGSVDDLAARLMTAEAQARW